MMSISPHLGQPTDEILSPSIQPHSLPRGNLDAGLEAAVGLREKALGLEARGREFARDVIGAFEIFPARGDD
jgi:hypothetical protein